MNKAIPALVVLCAVATGLFYGGARPKPNDAGYCTSCHEMRDTAENWLGSAHREVACSECHGGALQVGNIRRAVASARGDLAEHIRMQQISDLDAVTERCRSCHQQEYSAWQAGPHAVSYKQIFTDKDHNRKRILMDDCFRCHGMYFQGTMTQMVSPVDTKGPWKLVDGTLEKRSAIPCISCHQVHQRGEPMRPGERKPITAGTGQRVLTPSVAFYDRRSDDHIPLALLPVPAMREGSRLVKMSPDQRQALCYQCHAPSQGFLQAQSGDDRTPLGVHEGISCLVCHQNHGQQTRASCATCHPKMSNCGIDVEKMDTTFKIRTSAHNIHSVKCVDCHEKGVPKKRPSPDNSRQTLD